MRLQPDQIRPQSGQQTMLPTRSQPAVSFPPNPHSERTDYSSDKTIEAFYEHSSAQRVNTDAYLVAHIREAHPTLQLTIVPNSFPSVDLLGYATATGKASYTPFADPRDVNSKPLQWKVYVPPPRRLPGGSDGDPPVGGLVATDVKFGRFTYTWQGRSFLMYVSEGRDGTGPFPINHIQYVLHAPDEATVAGVESLIKSAGSWAQALHGEIWVFDGGFWQKDAALWQSVQRASWDDVILDPVTKDGLQQDVARFFGGRERYEKLKVAWKRGVIYYGPPGNGKTVSIKAIMHSLYERTPFVPTLYVKTLSGFGGPENSLKQIFRQARHEAPCLLVFEDLDAIITDAVRSYFLNEVDGLAANDGIMMVGSTNHLERLDPGISKRPSRFDRKFLFPDPDFDDRKRYAGYWRKKLADNKEIEFPEELTDEIARITDKFSFAYIQEAFVATLLTLASRESDGVSAAKDKFDGLLLWDEFKKQVKGLREELE